METSNSKTITEGEKTRYKSYSYTEEAWAPSVTLNDDSKSETKIFRSPSVTFGNKSESNTYGVYSPSATLGTISDSYTEGICSPSATLGNDSKSKTKGDHAHSVTFGLKSQSYTEGKESYSVTLGWDSISSTKGEGAITCAFGKGSIVRAHDGDIVIAEYYRTEEGKIKRKKIHAAKVGEEILGVTIEPDKPYGFDEEGKFRQFTKEEILEIFKPYYKNSRTILEKLKL